MPDNKLRFIIADDHPAFRGGIAAFLHEGYKGCSVHEAGNGKELLDALKTNSYDIIFVDIAMNIMNGIEATRLINTQHNEVKVIALSLYEDEMSMVSMFENGASGYLSKTAGKPEIMHAVDNVLNGNLYINGSHLNTMLWKQLRRRNKIGSPSVSEREKEILLLICQGLSTKEIAAQLHIAVKTAENHRNHLLEKTNARNTASLVLHAVKKGWV